MIRFVLWIDWQRSLKLQQFLCGHITDLILNRQGAYIKVGRKGVRKRKFHFEIYDSFGIDANPGMIGNISRFTCSISADWRKRYFPFLRERIYLWIFKHFSPVKSFFGTKGTTSGPQAWIKEVRIFDSTRICFYKKWAFTEPPSIHGHQNTTLSCNVHSYHFQNTT